MIIIKTESPEAINAQNDFINQCAEYTKTVIEMPDSPWKNDPIKNLRKMGHKRLGATQIKIITYLYRYYFSRKKPVFLKNRSIAKKLNMTRMDVQMAIGGLVKKGILYRITFLCNSLNRAMVLPMISQLKEAAEALKNEQGCSEILVSTYLTYICKTGEGKIPKKFEIGKSLYNVLLYFNKIYKNLTVKIHESKTNKFFQNLKEATASLLKTVSTQIQEKTLQKIPTLQLLKNKLLSPSIKPPAPPNPSPTSDRLKAQLKTINFDINKLDLVDRTTLFDLINNKMMIDINKMYNQAKFQNIKQLQLKTNKLIKMICWLYANNHDIDINFTNEIIELWNSLSNKNTDKFVVHKRLKIGSAQFDEFSIALSYYKYLNNDQIIITAINRIHTCKKILNNRIKGYKISLKDIIINEYEKELFNKAIRLETNDDWIAYLMNGNYTPTFGQEVNHCKNLFLHFFYQNDMGAGETQLKIMNKTFSSWIEFLIDSKKKYDRYTGELDLIYSDSERNTPSVIFEFFVWWKSHTLYPKNINKMVSEEVWGEFINYMNNNMVNNFWKRNKA
jgi:hypothetical protein